VCWVYCTPAPATYQLLLHTNIVTVNLNGVSVRCNK
jgi:hypothetical protein